MTEMEDTGQETVCSSLSPVVEGDSPLPSPLGGSRGGGHVPKFPHVL